MGIEKWDTTDSNNNDSDIANNINWQELQKPGTINNSARAMMTQIRLKWQDAQWFDWGDTIVYASATSFTITGVDRTTEYHTGRRIRAVGATTGTIYGTITSSSFSTNTTVNVAWESGTLQSETLTISIGAVSNTNGTTPYLNRKSSDVASSATIDLDAINGDFINITGTTAITAINLAEGHKRIVRFDGALTLTNGASLVLPGSANITTASGDFAIFVGDASSVVRCVSYVRADGFPLAASIGTASGKIPTVGTVSATESLAGLSEQATQIETDTGTDDTRYITPLKLAINRGYYMEVADEKPNNTNGGTPTTGTWNDRALNTVRANTISGASLASNQITLPAGTYIIRAIVPAGAVNGHRIRIYNVTTSSIIEMGTNGYMATSTASNNVSIIDTTHYCTSPENIKIQHYIKSNGSGVAGLGYSVGSGSNEIYTIVYIYKIK